MSATTATHVEFTYDWYGEFLDDLVDAGCRFRTYEQSIEPGDVLLRHDVDWSPRHALRFGRMEEERGVTATYFFLPTSPLYNVFHRPVRLVLQELESMGHDVGLHFSTHQYFEAEPADAELRERVQEEYTALAQLVDDLSEAVSFHRPPEWVFRESYEGFTSTYEERFFEEITYRGDSNQRWREQPPLADGVPEKMQVLAHPGLWGERDASFQERLATHVERRLGRTSRFLEEQFLEKRFNIDEYCEHVRGES